MTAAASFTVRHCFAPIEETLRAGGVHPMLARLYAARGVRDAGEIGDDLHDLLPPSSLANAERAALLLADAIAAGTRLLIVADYDCDGATACAVGMRALHSMGANVDFIVPDRFKLGYGLTPELVELCAARRPGMLITVDNGIASVAGVAAASKLGIRTLITDHHLPGERLPEAACIVNPNQPGCGFASKAIAGVGVMFYVMLALRAELRRRGAYGDAKATRLADLLPLVALGTVADVVPLDRNNRILVGQGLKRIRAGSLPAGMRALFAAAGRDPRQATTHDLGFGLGPRLNAAGRLADMSLGIRCLCTDDERAAWPMAQQLDRLNNERRVVETTMSAGAEEMLAHSVEPGHSSVTLYDPSWHQGVIGILAGRIKDRLNRPTFAFAPASAPPCAELRGSGRSIGGFHLRDCLDVVSKLAPDLLLRFGGHAAAAGVTIEAARLDEFTRLFEQVAARLIDPRSLARELATDGALESGYMTLDCARLIQKAVWGQGFDTPLFLDEMEVLGQRLAAERHLRLRLTVGGRAIEGIQFNQTGPLPQRVRAAYRLGINNFDGLQSVQLVIEQWLPV
jgi:single-stranded-DNA-specific exonuclease